MKQTRLQTDDRLYTLERIERQHIYMTVLLQDKDIERQHIYG